MSADQILFCLKHGVTSDFSFSVKILSDYVEHYEYETQRQAVADMRGFVRYYEFLLQVSGFEDIDLHKKYNFISYLLAYINIKHPGGGFNLDGKIKASQFVQKKGEEIIDRIQGLINKHKEGQM